jgi:hypothetical protein
MKASGAMRRSSSDGARARRLRAPAAPLPALRRGCRPCGLASSSSSASAQAPAAPEDMQALSLLLLLNENLRRRTGRWAGAEERGVGRHARGAAARQQLRLEAPRWRACTAHAIGRRFVSCVDAHPPAGRQAAAARGLRPAAGPAGGGRARVCRGPVWRCGRRRRRRQGRRPPRRRDPGGAPVVCQRGGRGRARARRRGGRARTGRAAAPAGGRCGRGGVCRGTLRRCGGGGLASGGRRHRGRPVD